MSDLDPTSDDVSVNAILDELRVMREQSDSLLARRDRAIVALIGRKIPLRRIGAACGMTAGGVRKVALRQPVR